MLTNTDISLAPVRPASRGKENPGDHFLIGLDHQRGEPFGNAGFQTLDATLCASYDGVSMLAHGQAVFSAAAALHAISKTPRALGSAARRLTQTRRRKWPSVRPPFRTPRAKRTHHMQTNELTWEDPERSWRTSRANLPRDNDRLTRFLPRSTSTCHLRRRNLDSSRGANQSLRLLTNGRNTGSIFSTSTCTTRSPIASASTPLT